MRHAELQRAIKGFLHGQPLLAPREAAPGGRDDDGDLKSSDATGTTRPGGEVHHQHNTQRHPALDRKKLHTDGIKKSW